MLRHWVALAAVVLGAGVATAMPAAAAGEHCRSGTYCLFSGTNYTGIKAVVPSGAGCHAVSTLGFPVAHSAARGFGDGYALQLFADASCKSSLGYANFDVPNTSAAGYRLMPIPSGIR
jgi:peptidase inhibitor family I36